MGRSPGTSALPPDLVQYAQQLTRRTADMRKINIVTGLFIAAGMLLSPVSFAAKADKVDVIVGYKAMPNDADEKHILV